MSDSMPNGDLYFTFRSLTDPETELEVLSFEAHDFVSSLPKVMIDLVSSRPDIDLRALLDTEAVLTVHDRYGEPRHFHGVIETIERGDSGFHRTFYHVVLMAPLHRLDLTSDCRIFQNESVPEIVGRILTEQGITQFTFRLRRQRRRREYCTQYRETNYEFIHRLLSEEGIFFCFTGTEDSGSHLILTDSGEAVPDVPFTPGLDYDPTPGGHVRGPFVRTFSWHEKVLPSQVRLRDHLFTHPRQTLEYRHEDWRNNGLKGSYTLYDYPGRYKGEEGRFFAEHRLEGVRMEASQGAGQGRCPHLRAGHRFVLAGAPHPVSPPQDSGEDPRYLVLGVRHSGHQPTALGVETPDPGTEEAEATTVHSTFTVISNRQELRLPQRVRPVMDGPQMAVVTGPGDEEIYCDEWGRVKVQFPWDRRAGPGSVGEADDTSSCWIRVSQGWAGPQFGHMAIPRVGQHVIVSYLDGDPDQPMVTGRACNGLNPPPYELPLHKTRMTLKSRTVDGDGYNELRFEDRGGQEQVYLRAERDYDMIVGNDRRETVQHDRHLLVGNTLREEIGGDLSSQAGENRIRDTGRTHSLRTGKDLSMRVDGRHSVDVGETVYLRADGSIVLESDHEITLQGEGGFIRITEQGIIIQGMEVSLNEEAILPGSGTFAEGLDPLEVAEADDRKGSRTASSGPKTPVADESAPPAVEDEEEAVPPPQGQRPLYPLRYAVLKNSFPADRFRTLRFEAYGGAAPADGFHNGAREVRPHTHLYVLYRDGGGIAHRHYMVTSRVAFVEIPDGQSVRLPLKGDDPEQALSAMDLDAALKQINPPRPFVTVPDSSPEAWLLTCDTALTPGTLSGLKADEDGLRTGTCTAVRLHEDSPQDHVLSSPELKSLFTRLGMSVLSWSQSQPSDLRKAEDILRKLLKPESRWPAPVGVVLHDPVGVMSELGHIAGSCLDDWNQWFETNDAARRIKVSQWIDELMEMSLMRPGNVLRKAERDKGILQEGGTVTVPTGVAYPPTRPMTKVDADLQIQRAEQALERKEAEFRDVIRDQERQEFLAGYRKQEEEHRRRLERIGADAVTIYRRLEPLFHDMTALYDVEDAGNFICLRRVVAASMVVCCCSEQGDDVLAGLLSLTDGPQAFMKRVLEGSDDLAAWVTNGGQTGSRDWNVMFDNPIGDVIGMIAGEQVEALLADRPPDSSSRLLSVIVWKSLSGRLQKLQGETVDDYERLMKIVASRYGRAIQFLEGKFLQPRLDPVGKLWRDFVNPHKGRGRPSEWVEQDPFRRITRYERVSVKRPPAADTPSGIAMVGIHFWSGLKFGVAAGAMLDSVMNLWSLSGTIPESERQSSFFWYILSSVAETGAATSETISSAISWKAAVQSKRGNAEIADALGTRADRFGLAAIGLLGFHALMEAIITLKKAKEAETGTETALYGVSSLLYFTEGIVGLAYALGGLLSSGVESGIMEKGIQRLILRSVVGRLPLAVYGAGAGPVGWAMLALTVLAQITTALAETVRDRRKFIRWAQRSVWGTGEPFSTVMEETRTLYGFFCQPFLGPDQEVKPDYTSMTPGTGSYPAVTYTRVNRRITLFFPGWDLNASRYEIRDGRTLVAGWNTTGNTPGSSGVSLREIPPQRGEKDDEPYHMTVERNSDMNSTITVTYWPNVIVEPDLSFDLVLVTTRAGRLGPKEER